MNILIINHIYLDTDLCATTQRSIVHSLNKLGHPTRLYVPATSSHDEGPEIGLIRVPSRHSILSSPVMNLKLAFQLPFILKRERADTVMVDHLTFPGAFLWILAARLHLLKTRFVFDVRSHPVSLKTGVDQLRNWQYLGALWLSKFVINDYTFLTKLMAKQECARVSIDRTRKHIGYWGSGVDEVRFDPGKYARRGAQLRKELAMDDKFIVFYHGVLAHNRGLDQVVSAMATIAAKYPDIVFFLLGDGGELATLKEIAGRLGLVKNVSFHPAMPHDKMPAYIAMMDVGIIPLPHHPDWLAQHPLKLSEYLAMSKPVIVTDIPAHTDILEGNEAGIVIANNDPATIAGGIEYAYKNHTTLAKRGAAGRKLATEKLTWDSLAAGIVTYLKGGK